MSTTMPKASEISRKWYILDAAGKPLGRVAAQAAVLLRGKHKPTFAPHADCGDHVIIINCEKAILTGKKLEQKVYYHHSGYVGGLKETKYKDLLNKKSDFAVRRAIVGMLPKGPLGRQMAKKLYVYKGEEYKQTAQQPEKLELIK